jgi:hypothetical protein
MKDGVIFTIVNARIPCADVMQVIVFLDQLAKEQNKDALMYLSHDIDEVIPYDRKVDIVRKFLFKYKVQVVSSKALNIYEVLNDIWTKGYKDVTGMFGDGFEEVSKATEFNGVEVANKSVNNDLYYKFDSIQITQDPRAEEATGESGKLLALAENGDEGTFIDCSSLDEADAHELYVLIRQHVGLPPTVIATRPEDRDISQLLKQRATMVIPRSTRPQIGKQGQMAMQSIDYTDTAAQIEDWLSSQVANPFVDKRSVM